MLEDNVVKWEKQLWAADIVGFVEHTNFLFLQSKTVKFKTTQTTE